VFKRNFDALRRRSPPELAGLVPSERSLAAAPQHHDQAPGFYRLKVGDLEVTALYDGPRIRFRTG